LMPLKILSAVRAPMRGILRSCKKTSFSS
jgi:hypothetical protein